MRIKPIPLWAAFLIFLLNLCIPHLNCRVLAAEEDTAARCDAVPLENAAAILNVPVGDLEISSNDLVVSPEDIHNEVYKVPPYNCTIRAKSNFLNSITYVTYIYGDPVQARIEFNRMREGFESVSRIDEVPDVGDEAFLAGDKRFQRLVVKTGEAVVDILSPKEFNLQKIIALLVVEDL